MGARASAGGGKGERTLEFIFAYVDGGWGVNHVGGEVVDHFRCRGMVCEKIGRALEMGGLHDV